MNCGDVIHRSTLDPVLRKEVAGPAWQSFALLAAAGLYLFSTPGVATGFYDLYIAGALQRKNQRAVDKSDLSLGRKLGSGAFGSVFKATLAPEQPGGQPINVVVKKAKEFGEAEVWMNERMSRASPASVAEFVAAFDDDAPEAAPSSGSKKLKKAAAAGAGVGGESWVWLVWKDEGECTLWDMIQSAKKDFPYNLEPVLLGRELRLPKGARRRLVTTKLALRQMVEALRECHATGIVHRDFKPQNVILSAATRRLKLIDFGAAADLKLGINYVPNEYLLDPRYAPPQQYIMSRQTPKPPPKPVAVLLSPVLWAMEGPDRFDMYSVGITLLQMAFPALRTDAGLIAFNKKLRECGHDLNKWRDGEALSKRGGQWPKDLEEGFEVLDAEDGMGWDLACKLVTYKPSDRLTAADALKHPWLASVPSSSPASGTASALLRTPGAVAESLGTTVGSALSRTAETVGSAGSTVVRSIEEVLPAGLVQDAITASNKGALTEAYLLQEFGGAEAAPPAPSRDGRQTIAWWQGRQQEINKKLEGRKGAAAAANGSAGPSPGGTRKVLVAKAANGSGAAAGKAKGAGNNGAAAAAAAAAPAEEGAAAEEQQAVRPAAGGAASRVRELLNVFGRR